MGGLSEIDGQDEDPFNLVINLRRRSPSAWLPIVILGSCVAGRSLNTEGQPGHAVLLYRETWGQLIEKSQVENWS